MNTQTKIQKRLKRIIQLISLVIVFVVAACTPQTPVRIVVTPTAQSTPVVVQITPDVSPDASTTAESTAASVVVAAMPTSADAGASETPMPEITAEVTPEPTFEVTDEVRFGPIIGEGYQFLTRTPKPTELPTVEATATFDTVVTPTLDTTVVTTPVVTPQATLEVPALRAEEVGLQVDWNMDIPEWEILMQQLKASNVRWLKVQVDWSFLQPDGPEQFDLRFQLFENHLERAKRDDFQIILSIAKAPDWARSVLDEDGPPDNPQDLANFIRFLLTRTKVGQVVNVIEIWNEPNLIREWRGTLPFSGAGYMQLFVPAYNTIREIAPNVGIVSAGLAPTSNTTGAIDDRDYLQQMYDSGFANYTNLAVGVHPYGWGNPPDARCCDNTPDRGWDEDPHFYFLHNLEEMHAIMQRNNHNVQIWVTEFGWATWEGFPTEPPEPWMTYNTPATQAEYTLRALEIAQELPWVGVMVLWNFNFANDILVQNRVELAGYSLLVPYYVDDEIRQRTRPLLDQLSAALSQP